MEPGTWASEHSDALRNYFFKGMSYAEIGRLINARFGTAYTRGAVIGRAKRLGLATPARMTSPSIAPFLPGAPSSVTPVSSMLQQLGQPPQSAMKQAESVKLRCVGITPRLIPLLELKPSDCRYPYGGDKDGEEISFCGHPRQPGVSYCAPHFHLTRANGAAVRATGPVILRLVSAA